MLYAAVQMAVIPSPLAASKEEELHRHFVIYAEPFVLWVPLLVSEDDGEHFEDGVIPNPSYRLALRSVFVSYRHVLFESCPVLCS